MKKLSILLTLLVLTAALLTGCRNPNVQPTELPPTQGATMAPTTMPTTMPTTVPTTVPPTEMTGATDEGNSMENGGNGGTTEDTAGARSRMPGMK